MAQQFTKQPQRHKTYEDDLLRKLQREAISFEKQAAPSDENDEEQALLNQLMAAIQTKSAPGSVENAQPVRYETLMITSAVPLTDAEKERMARIFIQKTQKPLRRITTVVDASLITGVRLQSETFYYEASGQKKLREMRSFLEKSWRQGEDNA
ncbi:MAG: F0F1 ATP synthase subunit delta [Aerococcaceae bacterium]|nr:F0F1 ATP synthase subunit delta [Aerococcaceae bacterium]